MSTLTFQSSMAAPRGITIDWSRMLAPEGSGENIDAMISWVKTYPNTEDIHVLLGSGRHKATGRKLQNALLALGCTVTNCILAA